MNALPFYIPLVFVLITIVTLLILFKSTGFQSKLIFLVLLWMGIQTVPGIAGFFEVTGTLPPRLLFLLLFPAIVMATVFFSERGQRLIHAIDLRTLTLIHLMRIPIELVLFLLFLHKAVPQLMTFEGRNFDILSGITAPLVYYFGFVKQRLGNRTILIWNLVCLLILLFTVSNAILSSPSPFQQFAFDQPTVAVLYFPFIWLPGVLVPVVIFSHLVAIRRLKKSIGKQTPPVLQVTG